MRKRSYISLICFVSCIAASSTMTSFAGTEKKIEKVSLTIQADISPGDEVSDDAADVISRENSYTVEGWSFVSGIFKWDRQDVPKMNIELTADDGYYFALKSKDQIHLNGAGADYVSSTRENDSKTLIITCDLEPLARHVGMMNGCIWTDQKTASWEADEAAGSYEVRLQRDGHYVGKVITTADHTCDLRSLMGKEGTYSYQVRGISTGDSPGIGAWTRSGDLLISKSQAEENRKLYPPENSGWAEPGVANREVQNY